MSLAVAIRATPGIPCRPWPRHMLSPERWAALGAEPGLALLAMWGDTHAVHALLRDAAGMLAVSVSVADGRYPALSPQRPGALLFERAVRDLWGHAAEGATDERPWLDHGKWGITTPLAARPPTRIGTAPPVSFLNSDDTLDQVPIGPLAGGPLAGNITEAGQFRLFTRGPTIARMEARLGYLHKGIPALMRGKSPRAASRFASRLAGAAPVAHSIAFARAAEAACDTAPPPRALALRAVMAELERIASHLADIDALAQAGRTPLAATPCQRHREAILRAANHGFGHRLMMDIVVPGGLTIDLAPEGQDILRTSVTALARDLAPIARLCEGLARRLEGIAIAPPAAVAALAPGGPAGRASGGDNDLRRTPGYPPYDHLNVSPVREHAGDAAARLLVLLAELRDSARMLRTLLAELPTGEIVTALPQDSGEGFGWAEAPRGDIWTWLRLENGQISSVFLRDPGWLILPLMEAAIASTDQSGTDQSGTDLSDWAVARASFGLSHAGMDL